jgi:DNA helicase HerA-like ATPase
VEHETEESGTHVISNHTYIELENQKSRQVSIELGEAKTGEPIVWQPGIAGSPHLSILGIPGQGKSWAIIRIAAELDKQHIPALVLDFHGSFANPQEAYVRTVHPTIFDAARGLPFSPFECTHANGVGGWKANAMAVAEIFGYVAGMGDMQQDIVFTAIEDTYRARGFHEDTTDEEIQELGYPTPAEVLRRIEQNEQKRRTSNVAARCRRLLGMDLFRPEEGTPNHFSLTQNGLVVDLSGQYSEELQLAAGSFLLRKLYKDMFHWGPADRLRLAIVLDEAHRLAKDVTLPKIMKEGRKFGIAVIVASQGLNDFHPDIINNVGSKIIFRMNPPESKKAAGLIHGHYGEDVTAHIERLTVGNAYVQTPEMDTAEEVEMYPLE